MIDSCIILHSFCIFFILPHLLSLSSRTHLHPSGYHLLLLTLLVILLAIAGTLYIERGAVVGSFVICYALTSFVGGLTSGRFFKSEMGREGGGREKSGGRRGTGGTSDWKMTMLLTTALLPTVVLSVILPLAGVAWYYGTIHSGEKLI